MYIKGSIFNVHAHVVSHQSKLMASSSIQHQLKAAELGIVLWYIYILKLDLIIHSGPPSLYAHTSSHPIKIWTGHKGQS